MNILITICARGGSKGIPGKNIKLLNGLPLLSYSIKTAQKFFNVCKADIALSTDSEEIRKVAQNFGLITDYLRPESLATDSAGKIAVISDLLIFEEKVTQKKYDFIIDLDVTSPLRTPEDIGSALLLLENSPAAYNIFSVSPANRNPYFNMVEINDEGYCRLVKHGTSYNSRQEAPAVYELNASFYIYRREFFAEGFNSAITNRSLIWKMPHICFDLDHPLDFEFLSFLIENNKLDFSWL